MAYFFGVMVATEKSERVSKEQIGTQIRTSNFAICMEFTVFEILQSFEESKQHDVQNFENFRQGKDRRRTLAPRYFSI